MHLKIETLESRLLLSVDPVPRPAGNTGTGFFVANGRVYDANGYEFIMKGPNTIHAWGGYTQNYNTIDQIAKTGANAARLVTYRDIASDSGNPWTDAADTVAERKETVERYLANGIVPVIEDHASIADGGSVQSNPTALAQIVDGWLLNGAWLKQYEQYVILNVANEWGPPANANGSNTVWRDTYNTQIARLRAGPDGNLATTADNINALIMVDAGQWGQDLNTLRLQAQNVLDTDPQHNIVFSIHFYGQWRGDDRPWEVAGGETGFGPWDARSRLNALRTANIPMVVGEWAWEDFRDFANLTAPFAAYRTRGMMQLLDELDVGWMGWSWNQSSPGTLNMVSGSLNNYQYNTNTDLSDWGDLLANDPDFGWKASAKRATNFPVAGLPGPTTGGLPALPSAAPSDVWFVLDRTLLSVPESGTGYARVKLAKQPAGNVTVSINKISGGTNDLNLVVGTTSLTFTTSNWDQYQPILIVASADGDTTAGTAKIQLASSGLVSTDFLAKEIEPPTTPSFTLNPDRDRLYNGSGTNTSVTVDSVYPTAGTPNGTFYMRFNVGSIAGLIGAATLRVYTTNATAGRSVRVFGTLTDSWTESATSGINASFPLRSTGFTLPTSGGAYVDISAPELLDYVRWQHQKDGIISLALRMVSSTAVFQTREGASPPQLVLSSVEAIAPTVTSSAFAFNGAPQQLRFTFSENVQASLGANDLVLTNTSTGTLIDTATVALTGYDSGTNTATFTFPGQSSAVLPAGVYTASINYTGVTDANGNGLLPGYSTRFLYAAGSGAADTITARRSGGGAADLAVWINAPTNGTPTYSTPFAGLATFAADGFGANDVLALDFTNGEVRPAGVNGFGWRLGTSNETLDLTGSTSWTFSTDPALTDTPNLSLALSNGAAATISTTTSHWDALSVAAGGAATLTASGNRTMVTKGLALTGTGTLDLNDNDLILDYTGATPIAAVAALIAGARNGGDWLGSGLTSTAAQLANPAVTTLGTLEASDYSAITGGNTFNGEPIDASAVLVKYTYYGDADYNGVVDFDDYVRIDAGYNSSLNGWLNGDFDGNGVIDFDDYVLIDGSYNGQGAPL